MKKQKELTIDEWKKGLRIMAENIVTIPPGEKVGRWTREDRIALVYSVFYQLAKKIRCSSSMSYALEMHRSRIDSTKVKLYDVEKTMASIQTLTVILKKTNGKCFYCGGTVDCIDHFYSKFQWKIDDLGNDWSMLAETVDSLLNLFPACWACNSRKGKKEPHVFMRVSVSEALKRYFEANVKAGLLPKKSFTI